VTGDLRHHVTLDALELGLSLIDAGHHATEVAAMPAWIERLRIAARPGPRRHGGSVGGPDRSVEVRVPDPSPEELEALLELQATDHRVRKLQHLLDDLPEQQRFEAAAARVEELGREHDDVRVDLERATAEQRQLERETDVLASAGTPRPSGSTTAA
jgi:hypothetical protein